MKGIFRELVFFDAEFAMERFYLLSRKLGIFIIRAVDWNLWPCISRETSQRIAERNPLAWAQFPCADYAYA